MLKSITIKQKIYFLAILGTVLAGYISYTSISAIKSVGHKLKQIAEEDIEILEVATLFHDIGYLSGYFDHEDRSKQIAAEFLKKQAYPSEKIAKVEQLIEATKADYEPQTKLEEIIKDADLYNLASPDYELYAQKLRLEWEHYLNNDSSDKKWFKENQQFLKNHDYYTEAANEIFSDQKKKNYKNLMLEKL